MPHDKLDLEREYRPMDATAQAVLANESARRSEKLRAAARKRRVSGRRARRERGKGREE